MLSGVVRLLPNLKSLIKSPATKSSRRRILDKKRVFFSKKRSTRRIAAKIAIVLICVGFFTGYQPTLTSFPPVRQAKVLAQEPQQTPVINPQSLGIEFKLPHPGYTSTYYSPFHPGVDIAAGLGMPVHPVAKGKVTNAGLNFWGLGLIVEIDHGSGYKSMYAHLGKTYVKTGQEVSATDLIGEVGMTGNTSGPHTHLEISKDGTHFNPLSVLPKLPDINTAWGDTSENAKALLIATPSARLSQKLN